ncbi:hypothetical protein NBRC10512v2_003455, partial [Rhodotorula toruloides]
MDRAHNPDFGHPSFYRLNEPILGFLRHRQAVYDNGEQRKRCGGREGGLKAASRRQEAAMA